MNKPYKLALNLSVFLLFFNAIVLKYEIAKADGIRLRPPFDGQRQLTSYFDHNYPNYGTDNQITIYNGESVTSCSPHCYQGHSGYDWSMPENTPIYAAASGIIENLTISNNGYGNRIIIKHPNGYRTLYAHLKASQPFAGGITLGQSVEQGELIGYSGNTGNSSGAHLHFGVYRGAFSSNEIKATDPFGWRGTYTDPLLSFGTGHTASCVWRSSDIDPISCADTVVEDAAAEGFSLGGTWGYSQIGHGFHMYFRTTTTANDNGVWCLPTYYDGKYKFYAWIPSANATSQIAQYHIWTSTGWITVTKNQNNFSDLWVYLGTYKLNASMNPSYNCVVLNANTGESSGTRLVGLDAIKIRNYPIFIPLLAK